VSPYVAEGDGSINDARAQLGTLALDRLLSDAAFDDLVGTADRVRFPVGFLLIRGDRGGEGKTMAETAAASVAYWNKRSSKYFDIVFAGWEIRIDGDSAVARFNLDRFFDFVEKVEGLSRWRYSGGTDLLLLHFDLDFPEIWTGEHGIQPVFPLHCDFGFDQTISLQVENMMREGKVTNPDMLMQELMNHAKEAWPPTERGSVWEISNRVLVDRGRRSVWDWVNKTFLSDAGQIYNEMRPYAVCDLRY
jgi:hypothetical protein